jgi:hypothetical protein
MVETCTWPAVAASNRLDDHGLGVVVPRPNTDRLDLGARSPGAISFDDLAADHRRLSTVGDHEVGCASPAPTRWRERLPRLGVRRPKTAGRRAPPGGTRG